MGQMQALSLLVVMVILGFYGYYRLPETQFFKTRIQHAFGDDAQVYTVLFSRALGMLFFAILPTAIIQVCCPQFFDVSYLQWPAGSSAGYWIAGLLAAILPVIWVTSKKAAHLEQYPQIRKKTWSFTLLVISALTWAGYLFAYEFLFRGLLFSLSLEALPLAWAVALNIVLYALVHWPKGKVEVLASIPFGLIIIWATIDSGTIWVAVIAHCALALSDEWFSLYHHPDIHLQ